MLTQILLYVLIFATGAVAGLKVIAPLTKTKVDDKILEYGEDALKVLEALGVKVPEDVEVHAVAASLKA